MNLNPLKKDLNPQDSINMKTIKNNIIVAFLLIAYIAFGQLNYNDADRNFENLFYVKAAAQYERIIQNGDDSKEVLQRIGDAYFFNTDMEKAAKWYGVLFAKYENDIAPTYVFKYIHALQGIGNYKLAKGLMKIYTQKQDESSFDVAQLMNNDERLDAILNKQPEFYISNLSINTPLADFGTAFFKDKILFSSSRDTAKLHTRLYPWNKQPYLDFYTADTTLKGADLKFVLPFSKDVNTKYHEATAAFNPEGTILYFTRNNYSNKYLGRDDNGTNHLKLYITLLQGGYWTSPKEVPFNSENYSVGQPALSPDGTKLYFVSDMPGNMGGTDIFVVDINKDGSYSKPRNLGPTINTSGREMFPYISDNNTLYFASDGHLGLGGLDIFESQFKNGYATPQNLGKPINSNRDDFAYIVREATNNGYFSSNRTGGKGDDDIYAFQRIAKTCAQKVTGIVLRKSNAQPTAGVLVTLLSEEGVIVENTTTNLEGIFSFDASLTCEKKYSIAIEKEGYQSNAKSFSTSTEEDHMNTLSIEITKELNKLIVRENGILKIKINRIYFDLNKAEIRPDAAQELNKIVDVMKEYPRMIIKIEAHTDARGSDAYNEKLSDKRAKATGDYIVSQGITANRIETTIGYGEKILLNNCSNGVKCSNDAHDINRRSEFIIVKID